MKIRQGGSRLAIRTAPQVASRVAIQAVRRFAFHPALRPVFLPVLRQFPATRPRYLATRLKPVATRLRDAIRDAVQVQEAYVIHQKEELAARVHLKRK